MASQETAKSKMFVKMKFAGSGGGRLWWSSRVGLLLFLSFVAPANARIESKAMTLYSDRGSITPFDLFGFKAGGTAEFEVNFKRRGTRGSDVLHAYTVGCKDKVFQMVEARLEETCLQLVTSFTNSSLRNSCYVLEVGDKPATMAKLLITRKVILMWGVVLCGDGSAELAMRYTFMNPRGQHLDTGHEPLPRMYLGLMVTWMFLLFAQGAHALTWHANKITNLHRIMMAVPVFKVVHCATGMFKWNTMSVRGFFPFWVQVMHVSAMTLNQAATFGTLLLVARGWLVTRRSLPNSEKQTTVTCITLLVVLNFAYRYYSLSNFSFFALAILYMTILALILSSVARNIRELKMQVMILRQADIDPTSTPAHVKAIMYRRYQIILFVFVCTKIFLEMVLLFLRNYPWITSLFTEVVDMILCVAVAHTFRLRSNNPFNTEQGDFSWLPFNPAELGAGDGNTQSLLARMAELGVQIALPLPNIFETEIHGASHPGSRNVLISYNNEGSVEIPSGGQMMVVVENPPTIGKEGELLENVAMAARARLDAQSSDFGASTSVSVSEAVEVAATSAVPYTAAPYGSEVEMAMTWIPPNGVDDERLTIGEEEGSLPELPISPGMSSANGHEGGARHRADHNV